MGNVSSGYEDIETITKPKSSSKNEQPSQFKIALLGSGGSGKTLLFKQLLNTYGSGFSNEMRSMMEIYLHHNIFLSIRSLVDHLLAINNNDIDSVFLTLKSRGIVKQLLAINVDTGGHLITRNLAKDILHLWQTEDCLKKAYEERHLFQFNVEHGIELIENYRTVLVRPEEWYMKAQVKTSGLHGTVINYRGNDITIVDTGGQKTERKKWKACYENLGCIFFIISLSCYIETCYEDSDLNRMQDTLEVFNDTVNNPQLEHLPIILIFNKLDLFKERIKKYDLSGVFPHLPHELRMDSGTDRRTEEFVSRNVDFLVQEFLKAVHDNERRQAMANTVQVTSLADNDEFKKTIESI